VRKERYENKMVFTEPEKTEVCLKKTYDSENLNQDNRIWMQDFPVGYWFALYGMQEMVLPVERIGLAR